MTMPILPVITDVNRPFWDAAAAGVLKVQLCGGGHLRYPIAPWCPECLDENIEWVPLSGSGTILSVLVFHRAYHPAWADRVPYNVVLVQLDEGPRMFSNVLPFGAIDVQVGDRVAVAFNVEHGVAIPRFTRVE